MEAGWRRRDLGHANFSGKILPDKLAPSPVYGAAKFPRRAALQKFPGKNFGPNFGHGYRTPTEDTIDRHGNIQEVRDRDDILARVHRNQGLRHDSAVRLSPASLALAGHGMAAGRLGRRSCCPEALGWWICGARAMSFKRLEFPENFCLFDIHLSMDKAEAQLRILIREMIAEDLKNLGAPHDQTVVGMSTLKKMHDAPRGGPVAVEDPYSEGVGARDRGADRCGVGFQSSRHPSGVGDGGAAREKDAHSLIQRERCSLECCS